MKIVSNIGTDRVIDLLRPHLHPGCQLDVVTPTFSLFAFSEMLDALAGLGKVHFLLPPEQAGLSYLGGEADRAARNRLHALTLFSLFKDAGAEATEAFGDGGRDVVSGLGPDGVQIRGDPVGPVVATLISCALKCSH